MCFDDCHEGGDGPQCLLGRLGCAFLPSRRLDVDKDRGAQVMPASFWNLIMLKPFILYPIASKLISRYGVSMIKGG